MVPGSMFAPSAGGQIRNDQISLVSLQITLLGVTLISHSCDFVRTTHFRWVTFHDAGALEGLMTTRTSSKDMQVGGVKMSNEHVVQ